MQLLRTVRAFLNNNHNKAREWLATSLPYLRSSLPPFSQLRSARVSSGQLYQPALPNPNVQLYLILTSSLRRRQEKGVEGGKILRVARLAECCAGCACSCTSPSGASSPRSPHALHGCPAATPTCLVGRGCHRAILHRGFLPSLVDCTIRYCGMMN